VPRPPGYGPPAPHLLCQRTGGCRAAAGGRRRCPARALRCRAAQPARRMRGPRRPGAPPSRPAPPRRRRGLGLLCASAWRRPPRTGAPPGQRDDPPPGPAHTGAGAGRQTPPARVREHGPARAGAPRAARPPLARRQAHGPPATGSAGGSPRGSRPARDGRRRRRAVAREEGRDERVGGGDVPGFDVLRDQPRVVEGVARRSCASRGEGGAARRGGGV
jgi:hypothetical protein